MQVQQHIYLQDHRRHSVAVRRRNDHMPVVLMEHKQKFFILNGLIVDRLTGPKSVTKYYGNFKKSI